MSAHPKNNFLVSQPKLYVVGSQKNCLNETVLLSAKNIFWLVGFVALHPKSTSMVIAGRSVHLTTLFPGQT